MSEIKETTGFKENVPGFKKVLKLAATALLAGTGLPTEFAKLIVEDSTDKVTKVTNASGFGQSTGATANGQFSEGKSSSEILDSLENLDPLQPALKSSS